MRNYKLSEKEARNISNRVYEWFTDADPFGFRSTDKREFISETARMIRENPSNAFSVISAEIARFVFENVPGSETWKSGNALIDFLRDECLTMTMFSAKERQYIRSLARR